MRKSALQILVFSLIFMPLLATDTDELQKNNQKPLATLPAQSVPVQTYQPTRRERMLLLLNDPKTKAAEENMEWYMDMFYPSSRENERHRRRILGQQ